MPKTSSTRARAAPAALVALVLAGCGGDERQPGSRSTRAGPSVSGGACQSSAPDQLGPYYEPGAPVRARVGQGYRLTGTVRSTNGCRALTAAKIEFWLVNPAGEYDDAHRATVPTRADGSYEFHSNNPVGYEGRPPHIHVRVSAPGHRTLVTQHYPRPEQTSAGVDLVLERATDSHLR